MTTFTINEQNEIVTFSTPEEAAAATATPFDSFSSQPEFVQLAAAWPADRLVAIWNSLAGVTPVKSFKNAKIGAGKIWGRIQSLNRSAQPQAENSAKPNAQSGAKKGKAGKKATTSAKHCQKAKPEGKGAREGSKTAKVIEMLHRKNGATLIEIMEKMRWQGHTVRGFMAGTMKKSGYTVESFKPEGGERTYRINK